MAKTRERVVSFFRRQPKSCEECGGTGYLDTKDILGVDSECPSCLGSKQELNEREFRLISDAKRRTEELWQDGPPLEITKSGKMKWRRKRKTTPTPTPKTPKPQEGADE